MRGWLNKSEKREKMSFAQEEYLFLILLDDLPNILTVTSLAHHGMLGSVEYLRLEGVDLSSVPTKYLASLASCVTRNFEIQRIGNSNLSTVLDNVKCIFLGICNQSLGSEETWALMRAMESRVEMVQLGLRAKLSPNITAVTLYSGQGKCRMVEVYPGKGSVKMSIEAADVDRYMRT